MLLSEIFKQLTYGELSQLHIGGAEAQGITKENQNRILPHVNLGLTELHKRFLLKKGELTILRVDGLEQYTLSRQFALSNLESRQANKYILDSRSQPYEDTLLKVEKVFDEYGNELGLNGSPGKLAPGQSTYTAGGIPQVYTPSYNTLTVPSAVKGSTLRVEYRGNAPQIIREDNSFDPEEIEVDLPYSHLEALLYYIASRVHSPVGLSGQSFHEGNNYATKFEQACMMLENLGYQAKEVIDHNRFKDCGWV